MTHLTPMTPLIAQSSQYGFRLSSISLYIWECWCIIKRMDPRMRGFILLVFAVVMLEPLHFISLPEFDKNNVLNFQEGFAMSFTSMVLISAVFWSFIINLILIKRIYPMLQCLELIFWVLAPLNVISDLVHRAEKSWVTVNSYTIPMLWFTILGGVLIALMLGFIVFLISFLLWLYNKRKGLAFQSVNFIEASIGV
ncbi:hypothetical protein Ahy_A07g034668 isoform B [Arachis hypogaea]|uniref:Uncharacterized protein n=1 Tax=Arachis hypogaea TaxID=3818 RepID=A0A445CCF4_ARAHY|nr:hypothetical protein Ahy_A07g034668 isoform B [Arachis hypogaea]